MLSMLSIYLFIYRIPFNNTESDYADLNQSAAEDVNSVTVINNGFITQHAIIHQGLNLYLWITHSAKDFAIVLTQKSRL